MDERVGHVTEVTARRTMRFYFEDLAVTIYDQVWISDSA